MNILPLFAEIHPELFVYNLRYMGLGMLCILIVMLVIVGITVALEHISAALAKRKAEANPNDKTE